MRQTHLSIIKVACHKPQRGIIIIIVIIVQSGNESFGYSVYTIDLHCYQIRLGV